jgi:hypothetical protein
MNEPAHAGSERKQLADDTVEMPAVDNEGNEIQGELALWPDAAPVVQITIEGS